MPLKKGKKGKLNARVRHRATLVEFISNPDNPFPSRVQMATEVIGYSELSPLYRMFSSSELSDIEDEGLQLRRKRYSLALAAVDVAMLRAAAGGDAAAARLCYTRLEGWSEKKTLRLKGSIGIKRIPISFVDPDPAKQIEFEKKELE